MHPKRQIPRVTKVKDEEIKSDESDASEDVRSRTETKKVQPIDTIVKTLHGTEVVHCKFAGDGRGMTKLGADSWFGVCCHVVAIVDGRQIIEFHEYTLYE